MESIKEHGSHRSHVTVTSYQLPVTSYQLPVNDLCLVSGQLRNHLICSQKQSISTFLLLANSTNIYNYIHIVQNDTISVIDPQDGTSSQHLAVTTDS